MFVESMFLEAVPCLQYMGVQIGATSWSSKAPVGLSSLGVGLNEKLSSSAQTLTNLKEKLFTDNLPYPNNLKFPILPYRNKEVDGQ